MNYFIALGSNKGKRLSYMSQAKQELLKVGKIIKFSAIYENPALGNLSQKDFYNAVCEIETDLSPMQLLNAIKDIEIKIGRQPSFHWGPREIDLDIIDWDGETVSSEVLSIPHREMEKRDFVLIPLMEIKPDYKTRLGESINHLIKKLPEDKTKVITNKW
jgi:2-amino-4-hydroxy-6-hydroxymethyldihydropteridine diphosphokinase